MQQGTVIWFNDKKGYGFIRPDGATQEDGRDLFVHYSGINSSPAVRRTLLMGQHVMFEQVENERGKLATNVRIVA